MLTNIAPLTYIKFKNEGYRIVKYKNSPVLELDDIARLAYLDVNRTITNISEEQSSKFKAIAVNFINELIQNNPQNQSEFDALHNRFCKECVSLSTSSAAKIHYGQAQKLLNMALKYLYNEYAAYKDTVNRFRFPDNNIEQYFHLPIDNQLLDALTKKFNFSKPSTTAWSKWHENTYLQFQQQIRRRLKPGHSPLQTDYILWNNNHNDEAPFNV